MAVTPEEFALAERVVEKSKAEAAVDTGRLKRSINKKVQRGMIVFREYFYGQYESNAGVPNSTLEENAKRMMGDIPYRLERLNEDGSIEEEVRSTRGGRKVSAKIKPMQHVSNARKLIEKVLAKRKKDDEDNKKDNRK